MNRALRLAVTATALAAFVLPALAAPPKVSIRPKPRPPISEPGVRIVTVPVFYDSKIRPKPRSIAPRAAPDRVIIVTEPFGVRISPRPKARPMLGPRKVTFGTALVPIAPQKERGAMVQPVTPIEAGPVCGDPRIIGRKIARIAPRLPGCGVKNPVRVMSVDGIALSRASVMNCKTAKALKKWVTSGVRLAVGRYGGGLQSLTVIADYSCRTRNNKKGAKISEHGKGNALDVAAFRLKNGTTVSVLKGWGRGKEGRILRKIHRSACGPFGTVLGPNSDRYHRDHFHVDTAGYRSGPYCR